MNWGSIDQFIAMGGHGFFVWGSYGVTALLIAVEVWLLKSRLQKLREDLNRTASARGFK